MDAMSASIVTQEYKFHDINVDLSVVCYIQEGLDVFSKYLVQ